MMPATRQLNVLIVDDDDVDRERVRRCLVRSGLPVVAYEAESGQDALSRLQSTTVDCVLLDNQLGDTTGSLLLQDMRQQTNYAGPIIMITGAGSEELVVKAMQAGASDYVPKLQLNATHLANVIVTSLQVHAKQAAEREKQRQLALQLREQAETLRQLDRTFQDILDQTGNLIGYWDRHGCVRFCNRAHHDWLGIAPGRLAGTQVQDALGPQIYAIHRPHMARALLGEPQRFEHELPAILDHCRRVVQVDYRPDHDDAGRVQGFYVTFTDMTQLVTARNQAQDTARVKSNFLANMSHEIRTPMNAIVGLSRMALEKQLADDARADIERVHDAAIALTGILDDILDHSKLEAGQMRIEYVPMLLDDVLRRTVDLFAGRFAQKHLRFELDIAEDVPHTIRSDALRLSQILNNLVGNAVKFTEAGSVSLTVTLTTSATPHLRFEVRDTGIGIEAQHQAAVFSAFTQEDASITRRFGGSGLGLSICRSLVSMMAGDIGIVSAPHQGSNFWFQIPLQPMEDAHASPPSEAAQHSKPAALWMSDTGSLPGMVRRSHQLKHYAWQCVSDLPAAQSWMATRPPGSMTESYIVLDWRQHMANLPPTVAHLRQSWPEDAAPPQFVLIVDGHDRQAIADSLGSNQVQVLSRPVLPDVLMRALNHHRTDLLHSHAASAESSIRALGQALHGKRALLVDDNPLNQVVAQAFLMQAGVDVVMADNGEQAVALASSDAFDVILMDMHMPVMDGLEATRRIRQTAKGRHIPILAMTAAVLQADRERCLACGMIDVVPKPIIAEHLIETLLKWIPH